MISNQKMRNKVSVADYLTQQIALSGLSQIEIARRLDYSKPNIITMFKQGRTKVPLNKVKAFATVLGVDPVHFLRIVMQEYSPETWETLEQILGDQLVSNNEAEILDLVRRVGEGMDIHPANEEERNELRELADKWKSRELSIANAAIGGRWKTRPPDTSRQESSEG